MIRPGLFICITAVLLLFAVGTERALPTKDPFLLATNTHQVNLDEFSSPTFAKMKVHHGLTQKRFDIGLFGNSRSLDVGSRHLKLGECSYFNFSLSGESLRASATLLEQLAAKGKAPKIALVSIDNFELQLYSNPFFPDINERWHQGIADIRFGVLQSNISLSELVKIVWRHAYTEWRIFKLSFNIARKRNIILDTIGAERPPFKLTRELGKGYRGDGSRTQAVSNVPALSRPKFIPGSRQVLSGYLGYDLNRLKLLNDQGVTVIVYESPLDPINTRIRLINPSPQAAESRKDYFRFCNALGLNCHSALGKLAVDNTPWRDSNHAPAEVLGKYLSGLLGGRVRTCKNDL
jgi:hypothetical protein